MISIALIGDGDERVTAHRAIALVLDLASQAHNLPVEVKWIANDSINSQQRPSAFDGLCCVPASPYRSMDGPLLAMRYAREHARPFPGTCGGFQHAVVEAARNVLHWTDADHLKTSPNAERAVISAPPCGLFKASATLWFLTDMRIRLAYDSDQPAEGYLCLYELNPLLQTLLLSGALHVAATQPGGAIRALEPSNHPLYVLTLFQPEGVALRDAVPPIVAALR
jgi:CTP synthase (UTP-ammonia lyase)